MIRPVSRSMLCILTLALFCSPQVLAAGTNELLEKDSGADTILRIIPPPESRVEGMTQIEVLTTSPDIFSLHFLIDGEVVAKKKRPPWTAKINLAKPAKEQILTVRAYGKHEREIGQDSLTLNLHNPPLRLRISSVDGNSSDGQVTVRVALSTPRGASVHQLRFFRNEQWVKTASSPPWEAEVPTPDSRPEDFIRVELELDDGRKVEDVEVIAAPGIRDEVDVNLVQLQALVTDKHGPPIVGLTLADFEIRQRGKTQEIDQLYAAEDISLVLGLVVDTSGSMVPLWQQTMAAANQFLDRTLSARDRAFIVSFDSNIELVTPLTGDREVLSQALQTMAPNRQGMTALYDSILFSMLQFQHTPGRRALVVLTDGFETSSRANPQRAVEFGRKLGIPVYVVALPTPGGGGQGGFGGAALPLQELKLLTEPTGGRMLRVGSGGGLGRAFQQIDAELRHQYILTYYTEAPPTGVGKKEVQVLLKNRRDAEVRAILALDQIQ